MKLYFPTNCKLSLPNGKVLKVVDCQLEVEDTIGRKLLIQLGSRVSLSPFPGTVQETKTIIPTNTSSVGVARRKRKPVLG